MKINLVLLLCLFISAQLAAQSYVDKKGKTHLWGTCQLADIQSGDYQEWYEKNASDYESALTTKDGKLFKDVKVKVFLGTWCGDTKYLVPKFAKSWEQMNLSEEQLEFIALHNGEGNYKQGPAGETAGYNIHRVPTFVFEREGKEIGRIVERTVFDLDTDLKAIANDWPYQHNYSAITTINNVLQETMMDSLSTKTVINSTYRKIRREIGSSSELNTYGYVLLAEDRLEEAEFVLLLNRYLFPHTPNVRDSYGEILMLQEKYAEAREQYLEALRLQPGLESALEQLVELNQKIKADKV